jgi:(2Fe-2S) ferredoxin
VLPEKHIFVCIANRPPMAGDSCGAAGSREILERLQMQIMEKGLETKARVNGCTCIGPCEQGVNMIVYPEGVFYTRVTPDDVGEIVDEHLVAGRPVERLIYQAPAPQ